jgi:hypothetical protein
MKYLKEAKLLAHYIGNGNHKTAKVYSKNEYGEHTVKHFHAGKHEKAADYYTNDLADAHGTAKHHVGDSHVVENVINELDTKTYKSYSKLSSKEADKSINRFVKGGNEKELTHAEKRSKGINTAQTLMARKNMKIESVEPLEESNCYGCGTNAKKMDKESVVKKNGKIYCDTKCASKTRKHEDSPSLEDKGKKMQDYNEETGHIALVNAIFDGNREDANEIFDTVLSGRINPIVSAKKEELAKTMFAPQEEVTEAYEPLPLTEEAEHGHHHRVHASLTDRKNDLSNEAHNGFMSGNLTKEHKKEVLKHVKAAEGKLDSAKAKLGSAESADHLNAAAVHITDGGLHLQNVRTYTSLSFRGY